jgi:hypothetical protein
MKTQAWGWLVAAVVAAGLNASYHDGGLEWAHRIADRVERNSAAVWALASGRADQFLAEARAVTAPEETPTCWATTLARVQARLAHSENQFAHIEAVSGREQAQLAWLEANRGRIEARIAARTARIRIPAAAVNPGPFPIVRIPAICPRVHVNIPRIPAPVIRIETSSQGPV